MVYSSARGFVVDGGDHERGETSATRQPSEGLERDGPLSWSAARTGAHNYLIPNPFFLVPLRGRAEHLPVTFLAASPDPETCALSEDIQASLPAKLRSDLLKSRCGPSEIPFPGILP